MRKTTVAQGCFEVICFAFFWPRRGPFSRARSDDVVKFGFGALTRRATQRRTVDFADLQHVLQHFYVQITDHLQIFLQFSAPCTSEITFRMITFTVFSEAEQVFIKKWFWKIAGLVITFNSSIIYSFLQCKKTHRKSVKQTEYDEQLKLVSSSTSLSGHKQLGVVVPWQLLAAAKVYAAHRCTGDHFLRICWEARCEIDEIETWLSFLVCSSMSQGTPLEQKASQHEIVRHNSRVFGTLIRKIFFIHYTLEGSGRIRS